MTSTLDRYDASNTTTPNTGHDDADVDQDDTQDDGYDYDDDAFTGAEYAGEEAQAAADAQE